MVWEKKPKADQCRSGLFRTIYFSQTACSIRIMQGDHMSVKKDSITSPQGVTNHVWDSTFIRKEPSFSNSQIPPPVRNLENKYIKNLTNVHPLVKELFIKIPGNISLPWQIKHILRNWEKLTSEKSILNIVKEIELKLLSEPVQSRVRKSMNTSKEEKMLVEQWIKKFLRKGAITCTNPCKNGFVSNLLPREKKDWRYRPVVNLKSLNRFIPYHHFKMEDLKQRKK